MSEIRGEELTALIDGELDARRAGEVHAAIAADPALRAEYDRLVRLDTGLRGAADATLFVPDVELPATTARTSPIREWTVPAVAAALLLVRLAPKFIDMAALGWLLQIVAAGGILLVVMKMASERDDDPLALA